MEIVNFLAQVWGFALVAVCLSLLISPKNAQKLYRLMEHEEMEYLHGVSHFVVGLLMVLSYNVWDSSWKTVITVLGWLMIVSGLAYMFAPKHFGHLVAKFKNSEWISLFYVGGVFLGCVLLYFSYTA